MSQFLTIAKIILSLFPLIIQGVNAIEDAFPESGVGAVKLSIIKTMLDSAYTLAADASVQFESIWPALERTIAGIVALAKSLKG